MCSLQHIEVDYVIIGSGAAGLSCALKASESGTVALLTKETMPSGNTPLAQGGIATVLGEKDTYEMHIQDTLYAGAGECDLNAVEVLVKDGAKRVKQLFQMGFPFDKSIDGKPLMGREGAHSVPRVISSRGDGSGKALAETLWSEAKSRENILFYEQTFVLELLVSNNECTGLFALDMEKGGALIFYCRSVVLATGGCGQIFAHTTNNINCTGDGFALAYRAGAKLENMEFIQFHPTALKVDENPMFLISEAVRGKGAVLVNGNGERFMERYHAWAELAPRDIVARGIFAELSNGNQVSLDVSPLGKKFAKLFPSIFQACKKRGLSLPEDLVPVVPAAHFIMGGIRTDLNGRTSIKGLYACGEVASTGVHGANRLASNSLLEGLVFGHRVGGAVACEQFRSNKMHSAVLRAKSFNRKAIDTGDNKFIFALRELMWCKVGLVRSEEGLTDAVEQLKEMERNLLGGQNITAANMLTVACLIARNALARRETLGSHYRSDFSDGKSSDSLRPASNI